MRTTWPPGHFYSPIVNPDDPFVAKALSAFGRVDLPVPGIHLVPQQLLDFMLHIAGGYPRLPFKASKQVDLLYYYENPFFGYGDAIILALILLRFCPKRVIEIGSGFSSCVMIDMQKMVVAPPELTFIEPFPEVLNGLLPEESSFRKCIIQAPFQSIPPERFATLEEGDVLFVDSTHVAKTGSDVNHLFFEVLPRLNKGVMVHIHDIFYPFDYPAEWIKAEGRSWNEAFVLKAFLQFNDAFEILFFNHYASLAFPEEMSRILPDFMRNSGGSIWLRKVR